MGAATPVRSQEFGTPRGVAQNPRVKHGLWLGLALLGSLPGCRSAAANGHPAPSAAAEAEGSVSVALPAPSAAPAAVVECTPGCAAAERCDAGRCVPNCPEGEVYIPATGPEGFVMGRGRPGSQDQAHRVILTQPFCMDETEVTVEAYRRCYDAGACELPQLNDRNSNFRSEYQRARHPINMVNWRKAGHYCGTRGQRLPTEAEWEWAAGGGVRKYPWGDAPEPTCDNRTADFTPGGAPKSDPAGDVGCFGGGTSPVKSFPLGVAVWPDGQLWELAGNVWEWTADCLVPYPSETVTDPSPQAHPKLNGTCVVRALRGGGWNRSVTALKTTLRAGSKLTYQVGGLGFRCVRYGASSTQP